MKIKEIKGDRVGQGHQRKILWQWNLNRVRSAPCWYTGEGREQIQVGGCSAYSKKSKETRVGRVCGEVMGGRDQSICYWNGCRVRGSRESRMSRVSGPSRMDCCWPRWDEKEWVWRWAQAFCFGHIFRILWSFINRLSCWTGS